MNASRAREIQKILGDARYKGACVADATELNAATARDLFFDSINAAEKALGLWLRLEAV